MSPKLKLKVKLWFYRLASGIVGGAAHALTAAAGNATIKSLLPGLNLPDLNIKTIGVIALSGGFWTAVAYLKQSPLPPVVSGDTDFITKDDGNKPQTPTIIT